VRKFHVKLEDLEKADTFHVDANEIWAGYDFEYALEKSEWERTSTFLRASPEWASNACLRQLTKTIYHPSAHLKKLA